jgi:tryptophan synthase alpha subunit
MAEIKEKITTKVNYIFFSTTKTKEFESLIQSSSNDVIETSSLGVTGSRETQYNKKDIPGSYDKYQNSIDQDTMYSVTLSKYTLIRQFRTA